MITISCSLPYFLDTFMTTTAYATANHATKFSSIQAIITTISSTNDATITSTNTSTIIQT